jgi:alpha-N-arabinofuranosidase
MHSSSRRRPGVVAWAFLASLFVSGAARADRGATFDNPVLPGFYPDPSVIRVGEDFYLVTSTFEYFPGVPIFHSRDLVRWQQIGHVLDRPSQLDLDGVGASDGIYAPTLREHKGTFYMVTTLVRRKPKDHYTNFVVTAKSPAGPWSDPYVLADSFWRIDPSLFFDDDGKAYYIGNRTVSPPPYPNHRIISVQELDLATMKLVGPVHDIGEGHARNAYAPEAPHLYKKDGYYYLLIAEGGTFETHAVTISRSKTLAGPYELARVNPILTHRHLGPGLDIHSVGHADLVDTPKGEWWMLALGMRGVAGHCCNLGRETFLVPVRWDAGQWPIVNPGVGRVLATDRRPALPFFDPPTPPACDRFEARRLGFEWNFVRTPRTAFWSLDRRPGYLRLALKKETLAEDTNPAFIGRRLQHADWTARTKLEFKPRADHEAAGLALRSGNNHLLFLKTRAGGREVLRIVSRAGQKVETLAEAPAPAGPLQLKVQCRREVDCAAFYTGAPEVWRPLGGRLDGRLLGHAAPGAQFTGAYVGMYATSQGHPSQNAADYDDFEYRAD